MEKRYNSRLKILQALRDVWRFHPSRRAFLSYIREEFPVYKKDGTPSKRKEYVYTCNHCGISGPYKQNGKTAWDIDHIDPICTTSGFPKQGGGGYTPAAVDGYLVGDEDWNGIINRLLIEREEDFGKLQLLCKSCHHKKTKREKSIREDKTRWLKMSWKM